MARPQRNPSRQYLNGNTRSPFARTRGEFLYTPPLGKRSRGASKAVADNVPAAGCQETSPTPMAQLDLLRALKSEDSSLVEADPAPNTRHARGQRRHPTSSPKLGGSKTPPKVSSSKGHSLGDEEERHQLRSSPRSAPSNIPATVNTSRFERRTQAVCMRGTGDWEPVFAMIDPSSKHSLLDPDTASMLGLTLHPIPRGKALKTILSNSSIPNPRFWAMNVGLRSLSIDLPAVYISIIIAPVSSPDAKVVIGRPVLQMLEAMAQQGATETGVSVNESEQGFVSGVGTSSYDGDSTWFSGSSSTGSELFSVPPFPGHLASVHRGDETYEQWIGGMAVDPESFGILGNPSPWDTHILAGCGGSFEGGEAGRINPLV